jgi:hypothetical protein
VNETNPKHEDAGKRRPLERNRALIFRFDKKEAAADLSGCRLFPVNRILGGKIIRAERLVLSVAFIAN